MPSAEERSIRVALVASLSILALGVLWGIYWAPLRQLESLAAFGPWATFAVVLLATVCLLPAAWRGRRRLATANQWGLASVFLGGASLVVYSNGLIYGQVAVVILLFYLTPIWSTLIARLFLGDRVSWWRYLAIMFGLLGIGLVLHGRSGDLPLPHTLGDWFGLVAGLMWAIASTGISTHSRTHPAETAFVFCAGGLVAASLIAVALGMDQLPRLETHQYLPALGWTFLIGVLWWATATVVLLWANQILDAPRVGILFMTEVVVGALSAALFTDEPFGLLMGVGAALVIGAAIFETIPARTDPLPHISLPGR